MMTDEQRAAVDKAREYLTRINGEGEKIAALYYLWMAGTKTYWDAQGRKITGPTGENSEQLVALASEDPAAWDAACMLSAGLLENSEPLPPALSKFTVGMLRGASRPAKRGRPKYANLARDLYVAGAVHMLLKAGFLLSRNDATQDKGESASSIVAKLLHIEESGIPKIWARMKEHVEMTKKHGPYYFKEHGLKLDFFSVFPVGN